MNLAQWNRHHNLFGGRPADSSPARVALKRQQMEQAPYLLDESRRLTVLNALQDVCSHRGWNLLAAHVRTNHVHTVVEGDVLPEIVMNDFKRYASRALNGLGRAEPNRKRWARHGSTRWLWKDEDVQEAIRYAVSGQGEAMAVTRA
jgi:REP element-mobilizing transposase RayT